jgi:hypothetical protein
VSLSKRKTIRPEFDHFYLKSYYPYLALSFYNLVPSCHVCNSNLKGITDTKKDSHMHPYKEGFDDVLVFRTGVDLKDYLNTNSLPFPISLIEKNISDSSKLLRANANKDLFHLEQIYEHHKDVAHSIFNKSVSISTEYIEGYLKWRSPHNVPLLDSVSAFYRHHFNYSYDNTSFYNCSLAKFAYDIADETGIIEIMKKTPALNPKLTL